MWYVCCTCVAMQVQWRVSYRAPLRTGAQPCVYCMLSAYKLCVFVIASYRKCVHSVILRKCTRIAIFALLIAQPALPTALATFALTLSPSRLCTYGIQHAHLERTGCTTSRVITSNCGGGSMVKTLASVFFARNSRHAVTKSHLQWHTDCNRLPRKPPCTLRRAAWFAKI